MATTRSTPPDAVAKKDVLAVARNNIYTLLNKDATKQAIAAALPDMGVTAERVATIAFTVIAAKPALLECDARSLIKVIVEGALLGLSFDPHLKQAHIVPYAKQATLNVGYMGLVKLARNGGALKDVDAHIVYEKDEFDCTLGEEPHLYHKPPKLGTDRGKPVGVYAIATMPDGNKKFLPMSENDVMFYREKSKARDASDSPWNTDPMSMWRKTAIRRLMSYMPLDEKTQRAVSVDELAETGNDQRLMPMLDDIDVTVDEPPPKSKTEERKEALRRQQEEEKAKDPEAKHDGHAGTIPAEASVETPAPPPQAVTVDRETMLGRVNNALAVLFTSEQQMSVAVSEATTGKVQSRAALQEAPIDVLDAVLNHLKSLSEEDLPK